MAYRDVPVLKPGKYRLPDGRWVEYTAADAKHVAKRINDMLAEGLRLPGCWMHDPHAGPTRHALSHTPTKPAKDHKPEKASGHYGWLRRSWVDGGNTVARVYFPDEADAKQFDKVDGVSPCLVRDWTDETGKTWPGLSLFHLASTPQPVQRHLPKPSEYPQPAVAYLGHSPSTLELLSLTSGGKPMADDKDKPDEADDTPDAEPTEVESAPEPEADSKPGGNSHAALLSEACAILKEMGIHVDHAANMKEFIVALKTAHKMQAGGGADAVTDSEQLGDDMADTQPTSQPMYMSLTPGQMRVGAKLSHTQRVDRIKALLATGRVDKPLHDDLMKDHKAEADVFAAESLSQEAVGPKFTDDGLLKPTDLDVRIAAYERLPKGRLGVAAENLGHDTAVVAPPPDDKAKREKEQDDICANLHAERGRKQ